MPLKKYLHDVDLVANELLNSRLHNITSVQRAALGLTLNTSHKGYQVYDTTLLTPFFWDGSTWNTGLSPAVSWGSITGMVTAQVDLITFLASNYYPLSSNPASYLTSATAATTYVPLTRNLTINGVTFNLSADRTWTIPSSATWGGITGTLSSQTDLQNALNAKFNNPTGTTLEYVRGDGSLAPFPSIPTVGLTALPFTADHTNATGNQYLINDVVYYNGNIYGCIANNDSILPTNTLYWVNLGAGNPLVQQPSDWNSTSGNNQILNKPTIPAAQVNSDWNAVTGVAEILNKPTIPAAQVNSDWNAVSGLAEILNKPTIPIVSPSALTKVDDTNVTLTLGGSPNTALLAATSLTLGWTGTLADSRIASSATWNAKEPGITAGTTSQYWRGDKTWQTFPTIPTVGTWGALNYPIWTTGTPFVKMDAAGSFILDTNTYVTSVGLSMPSAFTVTNTPVTSSGTLTVTGAGTASQYIRGDGALATFPSSTISGGASFNYYLNGSVNQGTFGGNSYYELSKNPIAGLGTDFNITADGIIARFITDPGDPALLSIPGGNWIFLNYFNASSGGGNPQFYINLYKTDGVSFTLIATNSANPESITSGTVIDLYYTALAVPQTTLSLTDRLAIEIFVIHDGRTITLHTENGHLSEIQTSFSTGLSALNGLTDFVQNFTTGTTGSDFGITSGGNTHTFNLPVASVTNTGKLSSTDWTTFNNKQNALISGSNIKTIEGQSLLGPGNIDLDKADVGLSNVDNTSDLNKPISTATQTALNSKQDTLVSGSNIKTINGNSLLGSGDLTISGGVTSVTGTSPIASSGGATPAISIQDAAANGTTKGAATFSASDFNDNGAGLITIDYTNGQSASATTKGFVIASDWNTFNNKQNAVSLTTTGTSGAATFNPTTGALNIPAYGGASGSGFGYTAIMGFNLSTLAASTTYVVGTFYGSSALELFNDRPSRRLKAPKAGNIVSCSVVAQLNATTYASPASSTMNITVNNLTTGLSSVVDAAFPIGSSLSWSGSPPARNQLYLLAPLAINQFDDIQIRVTTPAWTSGPATMTMNFVLFIE
jgi:hypothetical protein